METSHTDKDGELKKADLTASVNVSDVPSAMCIAGYDKEMGYNHTGDTFIFPAALYHYTNYATIESIKVVFFYSLTEPTEPGDGDESGAGASSSTAIHVESEVVGSSEEGKGSPPAKKMKVEVSEAE